MEIRDEFDKRVLEIDSFYEILGIVELENPEISAYDISGNANKIIAINSSKIDILRSTSYLLLYNLIESTVYNSITTIFDTIDNNKLKYFDIIENLQRYWLNNIYKHDDKKKKETIIETMMNVATQIFNDTIRLASNEITYGGSLDAQAIFTTAKSMNIDIAVVYKIYNKNTHGQALSEVKSKRNWLAHGEKSF